MKKKYLILSITACMILGISACGKDNAADSGTDGVTAEVAVLDHETEAPEDFVDNTDGLYEITDDMRYYADKDGNRVLRRDEQVFYNDEGFQFYVAANMITNDPNTDNTAAVSGNNMSAVNMTDYKDNVDKIILGDKTYTYDDLIMTREDGGVILEKLANDFGVDVYDENGNRVETAVTGDLDTLRTKFSESRDYEEYSARTYYIHCDMNGFNDDEAREEAYADTGLSDYERDRILYGTLALVLHYNTDGYDCNYAYVLNAPAYFSSDENFETNKDVNQVRWDISRCHVTLKDSPVLFGFLNYTCVSVDH